MEKREKKIGADSLHPDLVQENRQVRSPIIYEIRRIKPLAELRASDVPMGIDPYDLATDFRK